MGGYICIGKHASPIRRAAPTLSARKIACATSSSCARKACTPGHRTLDCGTLNFGDGNRAYISTPDYVREGAGILRDLGVKAELEVFDTGNLWFVKQLIKEG